LQLQSRTQIAAWQFSTASAVTGSILLRSSNCSSAAGAAENIDGQLTNLVAEALGRKSGFFLCDEATATLEAIGTSETPLARSSRPGMDRQAIANGGRAPQYSHWQVHFDGDVQQDKDELIGVRRQLSVRSQLAVHWRRRTFAEV